MNGNYVYVLPNNTMYRRMTEPHSATEMLRADGIRGIEFSGNLAVIRTRPGYASSVAYDIDNHNFDEILGTIAGDDTILLVLREGCTRTSVINALSLIIPNMK
jgi:transcriptional regulator of arginine metabolism